MKKRLACITVRLAAAMNKIERRFTVYDEDNEPIRKFYTRQEAINFLLDGWKIVVAPKTPVIDWNSVELAPF